MDPAARPRDALAVLERIRILERRPRRRAWSTAVAVVASLTVAALARSGPNIARLSPATLQSSEAPVMGASLSPDGERLAYAEGSAVFLKTLDTGLVRPVPGVEAQSGCVAWTADGTGLYVARA